MPEEPKKEECQNPWNKLCHSQNIKLYVKQGEQEIPICRSCWERLAENPDFYAEVK